MEKMNGDDVCVLSCQITKVSIRKFCAMNGMQKCDPPHRCPCIHADQFNDVVLLAFERYAVPNNSLRFLRVGRPWDTPHQDRHAVVSWCCCCYHMGHTTWGKYDNTFIDNVTMYNVKNATVRWAMKGMANEDVRQWVAEQGKGDNYSITLILRDNCEPRSCILHVRPCIRNGGWLQFWKALYIQ